MEGPSPAWLEEVQYAASQLRRLVFPDEMVVLALRVGKLKMQKGHDNRRRYLVLTVKRGQKAKLNKVKVKGDFQSSEKAHSWLLKDLHRIDGSVDELNARDFTLYLGDKPQGWLANSPQEKMLFVWAVLELCRKLLRMEPHLHNIDQTSLPMERIGSRRLDEVFATMIAGKLPSTPPVGGGSEEVGDSSTPISAAGGGDIRREALMTEKEEEDMEALLREHGEDIGDACAFAQHLSRKLAGLDDETIGGILDAEAHLRELSQELENVYTKLNFIDDWMGIQDGKLKKMRNDIKKIEAKNRRLETTTKNHNALLAALEELLNNLQLAHETEDVIQNLQNISLETEDGIAGIATAMSRLSTTLKGVPLQDGMHNMDVAKQKTKEMILKRDELCGKVVKFLQKLFEKLSDELMGDKGRFSRRGVLKLSDHRSVHTRLLPYAELVHGMRALDPEKFNELRKAYVSCIQAVYRRETHDYFVELRHRILKEQKDTRLVGRPSTLPSMSTSSSASDGMTDGSASPRQPFNPLSLRGLDERDKHGSIQDLIAAASEETGDQTKFPASENCIQAFCRALLVVVPTLLEEQTFCKTFFGYTEAIRKEQDDMDLASDPRELFSLMKELYDGLQSEFTSFIEHVNRMDPFHTVSIMVETRPYLDEYGETSPFLMVVVEGIQDETKVLFNKFITDEIAALQRREAKEKAKQTGILPFFSRFPTLVDRLEGIIHGKWRGVAYNTYFKLSKGLFEALEKIADQDEKYKDIVRLENYHSFYVSLVGKSIPELKDQVEQSKVTYESCLGRYVSWLLRSEFEKLFMFVSEIDAMLKKIPAEEVQYQSQFSRRTLHKFMKHNGQTMDKGLQHIFRRIQKHLTAEEGLRPLAWGNCRDQLLAKYNQLRDHVARCFPGEVLSPSLEDVRSMANLQSVVDINLPHKEKRKKHKLVSATGSGAPRSHVPDSVFLKDLGRLRSAPLLHRSSGRVEDEDEDEEGESTDEGESSRPGM